MISFLQRRLRLFASVGRAVKFASVGLLGTAVDFAVLIALVEHGATTLEAAKLLGGEAAIVVMFVANEVWTFAEQGADGYRPLARRFLTSNLVRLTGIGVATAILSLLVRAFGTPYLLANVVGVGCGFFVNFFAESYFTWRVHR